MIIEIMDYLDASVTDSNFDVPNEIDFKLNLFYYLQNIPGQYQVKLPSGNLFNIDTQIIFRLKYNKSELDKLFKGWIIDLSNLSDEFSDQDVVLFLFLIDNPFINILSDNVLATQLQLSSYYYTINIGILLEFVYIFIDKLIKLYPYLYNKDDVKNIYNLYQVITTYVIPIYPNYLDLLTNLYEEIMYTYPYTLTKFIHPELSNSDELKELEKKRTHKHLLTTLHDGTKFLRIKSVAESIGLKLSRDQLITVGLYIKQKYIEIHNYPPTNYITINIDNTPTKIIKYTLGDYDLIKTVLLQKFSN